MDQLDRAQPLSLRDVLCSSTTGRIRALKLCDLLLGSVLTRCLNPAPTGPALETEAIRRILVIRTGGIGDAVLALPLMQELARRFPHASLEVLAEERNAGIFSSLEGLIARCLRYDQAPWRLMQTLRDARYDLVIDSEQWHYATGLLAHASGAPFRIGFDSNALRARCYTAVTPYAIDHYEGDNFLRLLAPLGGKRTAMDWTRPWLSVPIADRDWVSRLRMPRRIVAIAVRGGVLERSWPMFRLRGLLSRLLTRDVAVCLLGSSSDRVLARSLLNGLPQEGIVDLTGRTSLLQAAAVLERSLALISPDCGLMHLGVSVGTPVVALFGASLQPKWAPQGPRHRVLNRRLPCSPCTRWSCTPHCPIQVRCLQEIDEMEVLHAMMSLLESSP